MKPPAKTSRSYASWIADLKNRWRATQIKVARNRRSSHSLWNNPVCYLSSAGANKTLTRQKCHKLRQNLPGAIANSLLTTRICNNLLQNWSSSRGGITAYQIKRLLRRRSPARRRPIKDFVGADVTFLPFACKQIDRNKHQPFNLSTFQPFNLSTFQLFNH